MDKEDLKLKIEKRLHEFGGRLYEIDFKMRVGKMDYLVILPGGHIGFLKIIDETKEVSRVDTQAITELRALGCAACVIHSESQINDLMVYIMSNAGKDPAWHMFQKQNREFENDDI